MWVRSSFGAAVMLDSILPYQNLLRAVQEECCVGRRMFDVSLAGGISGNLSTD
jgi:hypothetical protein